MSSLGVVAIGRNEGQRLVRCLRSVAAADRAVVYVDSGSTDGSRDRARELGVEVVELDLSIPFTAARARNAGFERLRRHAPDLEQVQFVDGDCEVQPGWLPAAQAELERHPDVAAVCGRRRERYPTASIYNQLCDLEWNTPVGEAAVFGGDVLIRAAVVEEAGGYDETLIAGEDPDLAVRIRKLGHRVLRLDQEMTLHDAAMTELSQWWKRTERAGHAYAEVSRKHGAAMADWVQQSRSIWLWGVGLPAAGVALALPTLGLSLGGALSGYGLLFAKTVRWARQQGMSPKHATAFALSCTAGKLPQAVGQLRYWSNAARGRRSGLIEYK